MTAMNEINSRAEDWQEHFDSVAYLNTYYGKDMFTHPGRFLGDYFSQMAERMHCIMETGQITIHNDLWNYLVHYNNIIMIS